MLTLVAVLALGQCSVDTQCKGDRVCVDGRCVSERLAPPAAEPSPKTSMVLHRLDVERPSLVPPILTLIAAPVCVLLGFAVGALSQNDAVFFAGISSGVAALLTGGIFLGVVIWARARIGNLMDDIAAAQ